MSSSSPHYLYPALAGALLAWSGWSGSAYLSGVRPEAFRPQLMVRPVTAELVTLRGQAPQADEQTVGRFTLGPGSMLFEVRQQGAPSVSVELDDVPGMTTVRAPLPRATLSISVDGDSQAEIRLSLLPEKKELTVAQNQARLEPGPYELLVQADGYLPQRLTVELKPGERRDTVVALKAIPGAGGFTVPALPASRPPAVANPPSVYQPPANPVPPPVYRPPAPVRIPPPVPVPRFTPVAPAPQPKPPAPVPMFTPIGN